MNEYATLYADPKCPSCGSKGSAVQYLYRPSVFDHDRGKRDIYCITCYRVYREGEDF